MLSIGESPIPALSATRVVLTLIRPTDVIGPLVLPERYLAEDGGRPCGCEFPKTDECECSVSCAHCWPDFQDAYPMTHDSPHEELSRLETACEVWPEDMFPDGH